MDTNPQSTGSDEYEDQDAEPTMTAPDGARPDGKQAVLQGDPSEEKPHGDPLMSIDDEMESGGGGQ